MGRIMQMLVDHGADMRQESKDAYMAAGDDVVNAGGDMGFVLRERDQTIGAVYVQAGGDEDGGYEYGGYSMVMADYADNTTAILNRELDQKASLQRKEWDLRAAEMANSRQEWEEKMTAILTRGSKGWVASEDRFLAEWRKWTKEYDREVDDGIEAWKTKIDQHFTDKAAWEDKIRKTTTEANIADVMGSAIDDLNKQLEIAADNLKVNFNGLNKLRAINDMIAEVRSKDPAGIERLERVNQNISNFSTLIGMSEMLSTDHYSGLTKGGEKSLLSEFRTAMELHQKNMKVYANAKAFESYQKMLTQLVEQIDKQNNQVEMQTRTTALSAGFIEVGGKYVKKSGSNGFMIAVDKYKPFNGKAALDKELGPNLKSTSEIIEMLKTQDDVEIEAFFYTQRLFTQAAFEKIVGRGNAEERKNGGERDEEVIGLLGKWIGKAGDSNKRKDIDNWMGGSYSDVQGNARALGLNYLAGGFGELGASGMRPGGAPMGFYVQLEVFGAELAKQEAKGLTQNNGDLVNNFAGGSVGYQMGMAYYNARVQTEVYGASKGKTYRKAAAQAGKAAAKAAAGYVAMAVSGPLGLALAMSLYAAGSTMNDNGTFSLNSQKAMDLGIGVLGIMGLSTISAVASAASSGFKWDEDGHQKGGWGFKPGEGEKVIGGLAVSAAGQYMSGQAGISGTFQGKLFESTLSGMYSSSLEYQNYAAGRKNNFQGMMTSGDLSGFGSLLGGLAGQGLVSLKGKASQEVAKEEKKPADEGTEKGHSNNLLGNIFGGFVKKLGDEWDNFTNNVSKLWGGIKDLGESVVNGLGGKGFSTNRTIEQERINQDIEDFKNSPAGKAKDVAMRLRVAAAEDGRLGKLSSKSMEAGEKMLKAFEAEVAALEQKKGEITNQDLLDLAEKHNIDPALLFSEQTTTQMQVFQQTNYSGEYQALVASEKAVKEQREQAAQQKLLDKYTDWGGSCTGSEEENFEMMKSTYQGVKERAWQTASKEFSGPGGVSNPDQVYMRSEQIADEEMKKLLGPEEYARFKAGQNQQNLFSKSSAIGALSNLREGGMFPFRALSFVQRPGVWLLGDVLGIEAVQDGSKWFNDLIKESDADYHKGIAGLEKKMIAADNTNTKLGAWSEVQQGKAFGDSLATVFQIGLTFFTGGPKKTPSGAGLADDAATTFYHGTSTKYAANIRSKGIDLSLGNPSADFGQGFYLTTAKDEALLSARRLYGDAVDIVEFRVPNSKLEGLDSLKFKDTGVDWQDFVKFHKEYGPGESFLHGGKPYDLVEGPMFRRFSGPNQTPISWPNRANQTSIHTQNSVDLFERYIVR